MEHKYSKALCELTVSTRRAGELLTVSMRRAGELILVR